MAEIRDPEVRMLAAISTQLSADYAVQGDPWVGSPFAWILAKPSRQKGAIGERLIAGWLAARGFNVTRAGDSDADRCIEGKRTEIKFSTLWAGGSYTFQQFRDQRYDLVICLGISPFDAHCWSLPKAEIMNRWHKTRDLSSQHGGAQGADTAWLKVNPAGVQDWLVPFGGSLRAGLGQVSKLTGYVPKLEN
jgi:hypothetical protein